MNAQQFHRISKTHSRSGLSIAAFCRKQRLPVHSFHYWRRRFGQDRPASDFVEVKVQDPPSSPPAASPSSFTLSFHGATLTLTEGFSSQALRACLQAIRDASSC